MHNKRSRCGTRVLEQSPRAPAARLRQELSARVLAEEAMRSVRQLRKTLNQRGLLE
ncbi:hypothetical protein [Halomonas halodenitrificans]|uniref:hypothetical protein n=1 Tax=Halomonas halodenitrificans TaxID=28252 RepID=UPI0012EB29C9|nr:hypothetical protein [Halomonas halodenitrificans]